MFALPNQIAKKGIENANAMRPILLEIENIIVKKGLYICKCGDNGAIKRKYIQKYLIVKSYYFINSCIISINQIVEKMLIKYAFSKN